MAGRLNRNRLFDRIDPGVGARKTCDFSQLFFNNILAQVRQIQMDALKRLKDILEKEGFSVDSFFK